MKPTILKETRMERKERLSFGNTTRTRVVESKKLYNRNRVKKEMRAYQY